jgi:ABC-type multidrug transport system fused ATPase/permease subunit
MSGDAVQPGRGEFRNAARVLRPFVREQRRPFLLALAMLTFEAITAVAEPVPIAYLIDFLRGDVGPLGSLEGRAATVGVLSVAIVLIAMVNALGDSAAEIYLARGGRMLGYRIRVALFSRLQRLSLGFHNQRRTGDVLLRVTSDVEALEKFVTMSVGDLAGSLLVLTGTLAFLLYKSWQVALIALFIVPILALISNFFSRRIRTAARTQRSREADLASSAQEMLTSIGVVQAYGRADYELERFSEHSSASMRAALRAASLEARFSWTVKVFEALATTAIVFLGLWLFDRSAISIGTLVLFVLLIQNMFKPTRKIIKEWGTIGKILASLDRIGDLLDRRPAVADLPGAVPAPSLAGRVEFDHVTFAYGAESDVAAVAVPDGRALALDDVSFHVAPGEVVALVGHSGAGKSTIASLVPRLYDPTEGRVLVDGEDLRSYTLDSVRGQVSMVLQETLLFSGTVADNIAYGRSDASREDVVAAAKSANADEFIDAMPDGYDTVLNERASNLSGGQRQRLAIARAFIRDTPILILDEPTTGLDAESTGLVLNALRTLMRGKATIIISHDLNLVRWANRVLVLRAGRVVQRGTHTELLGQPGVYAELLAQASGLSDPSALSALGALARSGNGNGHRTDGPPAPSSDLDLRDNAKVLEELPGLAAAFDAAAMAERFQGALFPDSPWVIERCRPGKATYVPGSHCIVRYDLDVRHREDGATLHPLLVGRLFPDSASCRRFMSDRVAPLVPGVGGRREVSALSTPVVTFDRLAMAVSAFPIDGDLPTLVGATDELRMLGVFRRLLPDVSHGVTLRSCEVHLGHYGRQHRCVLRYVISGTRSRDGAPFQRVVYGKVIDPQRARASGEALHALERAAATDGMDLRVPLWLGYDAELRLGLLSAVPGAALVQPLVRAELSDERSPAAAAAAVTLEQAVTRCAEVAATLHRSGLAVGPLRTLADELAELDEQLGAVAAVAPELAGRLAEGRSELDEAAAECEPLPLVLSHGDYTPGQVLFDGPAPALLDFDTVCRAEPALDLGQFLAYFRLAVAKEAGPEGAPALESAMVDTFLDRYATAAGLSPRADRSLRTRVSVYEQVSLLRVAIHSFYKLKPARLELVLRLLGQDVSAVTG